MSWNNLFQISIEKDAASTRNDVFDCIAIQPKNIFRKETFWKQILGKQMFRKQIFLDLVSNHSALSPNPR